MTVDVAQDALTRALTGRVNEHLTLWGLPEGAAAKLFNVSENVTFRIASDGTSRAWALRLHRPGYHSRRAIQSELSWASALRTDGVAMTPEPVAGRDGDLIQSVPMAGSDPPRLAVLSHWESGTEPTQADVQAFAAMGDLAARLHDHARRWTPPIGFKRHSWDFVTTLGTQPRWGRWQDGIGVTPEIAGIFGRAADLIGRRLASFGKGPERFGLVHGDMRLANLLLDQGTLKLLDFDDCGYSWLLYDCATTVSFFEHDPIVPDLIAAWTEGYRRRRPLSAEDEAEISTFVLLRRLLLVAWLGSHGETDLAKALGAAYTRNSVPLCDAYLSAMQI